MILQVIGFMQGESSNVVLPRPRGLRRMGSPRDHPVGPVSDSGDGVLYAKIRVLDNAFEKVTFGVY